MSAKKIRIPDSELEVLQVLWEKGPSTAREIREKIQEKKTVRLAHSTIVSFIQRLEQKGQIVRTGKQVGKAFVYRAKAKPDSIRERIVRKFHNRLLGDDMVPVFFQLIDSSDLSLDEIEQIRAKLDQEERRKKDKNDDL